MECVDFAERLIPVGKIQWFLNIVIYLQLFTGETVSTAELHKDEVHKSKVRNMKDQLIVISGF